MGGLDRALGGCPPGYARNLSELFPSGVQDVIQAEADVHPEGTRGTSCASTDPYRPPQRAHSSGKSWQLPTLPASSVQEAMPIGTLCQRAMFPHYPTSGIHRAPPACTDDYAPSVNSEDPAHQGTNSLHEFLNKARLIEYYSIFQKMGANVAEDLKDVTEEDLVDIHMPILAIRRFRKAVDNLSCNVREHETCVGASQEAALARHGRAHLIGQEEGPNCFR